VPDLLPICTLLLLHCICLRLGCLPFVVHCSWDYITFSLLRLHYTPLHYMQLHFTHILPHTHTDLITQHSLPWTHHTLHLYLYLDLTFGLYTHTCIPCCYTLHLDLYPYILFTHTRFTLPGWLHTRLHRTHTAHTHGSAFTHCRTPDAHVPHAVYTLRTRLRCCWLRLLRGCCPRVTWFTALRLPHLPHILRWDPVVPSGRWD